MGKVIYTLLSLMFFTGSMWSLKDPYPVKYSRLSASVFWGGCLVVICTGWYKLLFFPVVISMCLVAKYIWETNNGQLNTAVGIEFLLELTHKMSMLYCIGALHNFNYALLFTFICYISAFTLGIYLAFNRK